MDAQFVKACRSENDLPPEALDEVAVAGRSNCGKSSLINALTERTKLARTSSTPGRTREIIYYHLQPAAAPPFYLVDLPGYGYAKAGHAQIREWGDFIPRFLKERKTLRLLLLLMDARRGPEAEELELASWLQQQGIVSWPILTKLDKVKRSQQLAVRRDAGRAFGQPTPMIGVSTQEQQLIDALRQRLFDHLSSG